MAANTPPPNAEFDDLNPPIIDDETELGEAEDAPQPKVRKSRPYPSMSKATGQDALCALALATIGRLSHGESLAVGELAHTAAPFLAGVFITHLFADKRLRPFAIYPTGVIVVAGTWAGGMIGRLLLQENNPPAFMAITATFLTATMLGWRGVAALLRKRRAHVSS